MCWLLLAKAIKFEKIVNNTSIVIEVLNRSLRTLHWRWVLGLVHGDFVLDTSKSQVPCKLYFNGLSRLKSWDLGLHVNWPSLSMA